MLLIVDFLLTGVGAQYVSSRYQNAIAQRNRQTEAREAIRQQAIRIIDSANAQFGAGAPVVGDAAAMASGLYRQVRNGIPDSVRMGGPFAGADISHDDFPGLRGLAEFRRQASRFILLSEEWDSRALATSARLCATAGPLVSSAYLKVIEAANDFASGMRFSVQTPVALTMFTSYEFEMALYEFAYGSTDAIARGVVGDSVFRTENGEAISCRDLRPNTSDEAWKDSVTVSR